MMTRRSNVWSVSAVLVIATGLGATACGKEQAPAVRLSGAGESCLRTADCETPLTCVASVCTSKAESTSARDDSQLSEVLEIARVFEEAQRAEQAQAPSAAAPTNTPNAAVPAQAAGAVVPTQPTENPAPLPNGYVVPTAASAKERAVLFPVGDPARSRKLNTEGLRLRKLGKHKEALASYIAAYKASPANEAARYKAACEAALSENPEARALVVPILETLLRQGTREARVFVAEARFDPDFKAVADNPNFWALVDSVAIDPSEPLGVQLCADPARVASLLDVKRGLVTHVERESARSDVRVPPPKTTHVTGRETLAAALSFLKEAASSMCEPDLQEVAGDSALLNARLGLLGDKDVSCLSFATEIEWSSEYRVCLVRHDGAWRLAALAEVPSGPLDQEMYDGIQLRMNTALARGVGLYGKALPR